MNNFIVLHVGHTTQYHEHIQLWAPESKGYVVCIDRAGRYSEEEARRICNGCCECVAVPYDYLNKFARSTPYYLRERTGTVAKFYDGDSHRPIQNSKQDWKIILKSDRLIGKCKPTPARSFRSFYIDGVDLAVRQPLHADPVL